MRRVALALLLAAAALASQATMIVSSGPRLFVAADPGGGGGDVPAYIQALSPYEVLQLDTTSGAATMQAALTAAGDPLDDWLTSDPGIVGFSAVIFAWSGGAGDAAGRRLFIHGAGHCDSANNGIYTYELGSGETPIGFVVEPGSLSQVGQVPGASSCSASHATYSDGKPTAVHTYDGVWYDSGEDCFYRTAGAIWASGGFTNDTWRYCFDDDEWEQLTDNPDGSEVPLSVFDPGSGKTVYTRRGASSAYFRRANDTWSGGKAITSMTSETYPILVNDTSRGRVLALGDDYNRRWTIDWSAETISDASFSPSGDCDILGGAALSAHYDTDRDSFWVFNGEDAQILELDAGTFACDETTLTGDSFTLPGQYNGTYKRSILIPDWRVILYVSDVDEPAYLIKLPEAA